jgi:hypothetical protein
MIETCKTVLAKGRDLPPVDAATRQVVGAILQQAKEEVPNDKVLAAVVFEGAYMWTGILTTMQIVQSSLPPTTQEPYLTD